MVKFTFLTENRTLRDDIGAEHGLSVFIETDEMKILFDAGSTDLFAENADKLGICLNDADAAVVSHGHYDHTGGIPLFCRKNDHAPIYIHKNAFGDFHGTENGRIKERPCGIRWNPDDYPEVKKRMVLTDGITYLSDNAAVSGTIKCDRCDVPEKFYRVEKDGSAEEDDLSHEQFLVIRDKKLGLFVFSGCSHKGILPALEYASSVFPDEKIYGIVAGMHLLHADDDEIERTIEAVKSYNPHFAAPVHCTGERAIELMRDAFGSKYVRGTAGESYEYK